AFAVMLAVPAVSAGQDAAPPAAAAPNVQAAMAPDGRRHAIRMMEAILSRAVLTGAEHLAEQLGSGNPNMSFFTGQARARGFVLDGYGVFFHVEIPEMQQSVVFSVTQMERDVALASSLETLSRVVESAPDGAAKLQAEVALKRLQLQFGPVPQLPSPTEAAAPRGAILSAEATPVADRTERMDDPIPALIMRDPNAAYRDAIKSALIEAMLEHSRGVSIQPDEWLSVAARRGDSPLAPNEIVTTSTLVLRIKGSDLAIYETDRTRKDEIRQRVEVREF
ncbi:MAG: hypothetical protein ACRD15_19690, partial [Vicinamibacterales bacterium]